MNNVIFHKPPVTSAQCIIGTEEYPAAGVLLNCDDDDFSQGYAQIEETFRALTEDDILKPFKSIHDFRSTNVNDAGEVDDSVSCSF